jgi:hypothetical protein
VAASGTADRKPLPSCVWPQAIRLDSSQTRFSAVDAPPMTDAVACVGIVQTKAFCEACRTPFFPVYLASSFTMEVAWGGLNFHINEIFAVRLFGCFFATRWKSNRSEKK